MHISFRYVNIYTYIRTYVNPDTYIPGCLPWGFSPSHPPSWGIGVYSRRRHGPYLNEVVVYLHIRGEGRGKLLGVCSTKGFPCIFSLGKFPQGIRLLKNVRDLCPTDVFREKSLHC